MGQNHFCSQIYIFVYVLMTSQYIYFRKLEYGKISHEIEGA